MTDITTQQTVPTKRSIWSARNLWAALALVALVIIGDVLIWHRYEGVNILVFGIALIAAIVAVHPHKLGEGRTVVLILVALLGVSPFFEAPSVWALLTAQGGIALLALGISDNLPRFERWGAAFARFGLLAPFRLIGDAFEVMLSAGQQRIAGRVLRGAVMWIVPAVFAIVFVLLFAAANPVIELGLRAIRLDKLLELLELPRIILWGFIAVTCWPLLVPRLLDWTALLAAAFVLAAMRKDGAGQDSPLIRNLVYLWIAQNVWLVASSVVRLKLYVEIYYLSEMRVAAFIWMGLVAIGLVLIVVKIALNRSNAWLVMSNMAILSVVLWGVAWTDIRSFIAFYNVRHSYEVTGEGVPLDVYYMSELGPSAVPALDELLATARHADRDRLRSFRLTREELAQKMVDRDPGTGTAERRPESWHGWTWRSERLENYILAHPFAPVAGTAID